MKRILLAIFLSFFALFPTLTQAAGIGVTPKSLEIIQNNLTQSTTDIFVHNTGELPALYVVEADKWPMLITAQPKQFRLEAGEARAVAVIFNQLPPGEYTTHISIIAEEISEENLPKTGVKLPVQLSVSEIDKGAQARLVHLAVGLFVLALAFLLLAYLQYRKWSVLKRVGDQVQESTFKRFSKKKLLMHYLKNHSLLVISLVAVIIAGALLVASFLSQGESWQNQELSQRSEVDPITVTIQDPFRNRVFTLETQGQMMSAFTALQKVSEMYTIPLTYDPPDEMGVFVTMIGGFKNGEDGKYWVYEIDGEQVPVAADRQAILPGQELLWKFSTPDIY